MDLIRREDALMCLTGEYPVDFDTKIIKKIIKRIRNLPSVKPDVIHCRECTHRSGDYCHYDGRSEFVKPDHFCGYGAKE